MTQQADPHDGRDETEAERADRRFGELMQEVRVAQTGVQILFAFLLTLPFSARFDAVSRLDKYVYVVTLIAAAAASALLIAPVSYHRVVFRHRLKSELVAIASRLAKIGLACLLIAIVGAVFVVMDVVINVVGACIVAGLIAALCGILWYILPFRARARLR